MSNLARLASIGSMRSRRMAFKRLGVMIWQITLLQSLLLYNLENADAAGSNSAREIYYIGTLHTATEVPLAPGMLPAMDPENFTITDLALSSISSTLTAQITCDLRPLCTLIGQ